MTTAGSASVRLWASDEVVVVVRFWMTDRKRLFGVCQVVPTPQRLLNEYQNSGLFVC